LQILQLILSLLRTCTIEVDLDGLGQFILPCGSCLDLLLLMLLQGDWSNRERDSGTVFISRSRRNGNSWLWRGQNLTITGVGVKWEVVWIVSLLLMHRRVDGKLTNRMVQHIPDRSNWKPLWCVSDYSTTKIICWCMMCLTLLVESSCLWYVVV
jgi:hypothetical protein